MNTHELQELWTSAANGLSTDRARSLAAAAVEHIHRERRRRQWLLLYVFVMVPLATAFILWRILEAGLQGTGTPLLILAAQWITALLLWRMFRGSPTATRQPQPIRATLETLLQQAEVRCRELKTLLALFAVCAPLAAVAILQLQASGKMRPHEATSAGVVFGTILAAASGWILFDLLTHKLPERQRLRSLMREYR
jgi:hypothetical protein